MKTLLIDTLLDIARLQLGVRESTDKDGNHTNSGPQVEEYQSATTLGGTGWPWCGALIAFVIRETAKKLGIAIPWSNSASCDVILTDARTRGLLQTSPQPGDVFLIRARLSSGKYSEHDMIHTGIVESVNTLKGTFTEIAGNTNSDGGREGIGVMRTTRNLNARYYFVRVVDGVSDEVLESLSARLQAPTQTPRPWTASVQLPRGGSGGALRGLPCIVDGATVLVPVREWAGVTGQTVGFDIGHQVVLLSGKEVALQPRYIGGHAYFPIRQLCEMAGGLMMVNAQARTARAVFS